MSLQLLLRRWARGSCKERNSAASENLENVCSGEIEASHFDMTGATISHHLRY